MGTDSSTPQLVRFEVLVSSQAYHSVLEGLRRRPRPLPTTRSRRHGVRAEVELNLTSKQFTLMAIDGHTLPLSLSVAPGSKTHKTLCALLALQVKNEARDEVASLFRSIIDATQSVATDTLAIMRGDLTVSDRPVQRERSSLAFQLTKALAPTLTLDLDDTPTLVVPEPRSIDVEAAVHALQGAYRSSTPTVLVEGNTAWIELFVTLPAIPDAEIEVFLHWGSYNDIASPWRDELVARVSSPNGASVRIEHTIRTSTRGHYGATAFVQIAGSATPVWLGKLWHDDIRFWVDCDDTAYVQRKAALLNDARADALRLLSEAIGEPHNANEVVSSIQRTSPFLSVGELLREVVAHSSERSELAQRITAIPALAPHLKNYGIGEVVFATPEGPHAAAGGLAQVISGLPPELARAGIPATIITPLYACSNGNKHRAAESILVNGFSLEGQTTVPSYIGTIDVQLGPTHHSGSTTQRRQISRLPVAVYLAEFERIRFFLLSNASVFDRLYQPVFADEQLRRAIVLSRATLEVIATEHFGIRPSALISNDWLTACIPSLAALDRRYKEVPWLAHCKTVHMIHNGGADYHGRLPLHVNNEDLWPMFNVASEHFFGFMDPYRRDLLNLTMAAARHTTGGVLTVSQPYARQLVSSGGGDGLEQILCAKQESVFGISNGINREEINRYLSHLAGDIHDPMTDLAALIDAKRRRQRTIQERYGLSVDPNARLMSCVGRMVEQKGISLLSGFMDHGAHSCLEEILMRNPEIQLLFVGPLTPGDQCASDLAAAIAYLRGRYPGRVAAHFDYIPHSESLDIIFGSTFFLMPSRFEPGGITQLEALTAGTLVIGRNVGGISATIANFNAEYRTGNGFLCNDYSPTAFAHTACWAVACTRCADSYSKLVENARSAQHSWADRVATYQAVLQQIVLGAEASASPAMFRSHDALANNARA